jgi:hypothetical protein
MSALFQGVDVDFLGDGVGSLGRAIDQMLLHGLSMADAVSMLRERMLLRALEAHGGNITQAGRALGQHRNTITRELERLNLSHVPAQIRRRLAASGCPAEQTELIFKAPKKGIALLPKTIST